MSTGANLAELMTDAIERMPSLNGAAFYMDRDVKSMLGKQMTYLTRNSTLTHENAGGHVVTRFNGIPIRRCDRLATDEATIS